MADDKDKKIPEVPHLENLTGKEKIPVSANGEPRYVEVEQIVEKAEENDLWRIEKGVAILNIPGYNDNSIINNGCNFTIVGGAKNNVADSPYGLIVGVGNQLRSPYELTSGLYNKPARISEYFGKSGNNILSIGNGRDDNNRHNAFEVRQSGDIYIPDTNAEGEYYQKPMLHLQGELSKIRDIESKVDDINLQPIEDGLAAIENKIPSQATSDNKLADKDFVNSSIATSTAEFKGTHDSLESLQAVTADANDYGFVVTKDSDGNTVYKRYKYVEGAGWVYEFDLNNSSFTAAQWASIQSGITPDLVTKLMGFPNSAEILTSSQAATKYAPLTNFNNLSLLVDNINEGVGHLNNEIKSATDGCFISYHRKDDGSQMAVPYWSWPELERRGEVADGVLVLIDGQAPIVVSPTGFGPVNWSERPIAVNPDVGDDYSKVYVDYSGKTRTSVIMAKGEELFGKEEEAWKESYPAPWCNAYDRSHNKGDGTMIGLGAGNGGSLQLLS